MPGTFGSGQTQSRSRRGCAARALLLRRANVGNRESYIMGKSGIIPSCPTGPFEVSYVRRRWRHGRAKALFFEDVDSRRGFYQRCNPGRTGFEASPRRTRTASANPTSVSASAGPKAPVESSIEGESNGNQEGRRPAFFACAGLEGRSREDRHGGGAFGCVRAEDGRNRETRQENSRPGARLTCGASRAAAAIDILHGLPSQLFFILWLLVFSAVESKRTPASFSQLFVRP